MNKTVKKKKKMKKAYTVSVLEYLDFEFFQNISHIINRKGTFEWLLLCKADLVMQLVKLFNECLLSDRRFTDVSVDVIFIEPLYRLYMFTW